MIDRVFRECSMFADGKLCRKPVRNPQQGALGFCNEHVAHGMCCHCGKFWLSLPGPGRIEHAGETHTAFACRSERSPGKGRPMADGWPSLWFRPVVSVREAYRTKRGEPVGEATLACGHKTLVSMKRKAVRRACWSCRCENRSAWRVHAADEKGRHETRREGR